MGEGWIEQTRRAFFFPPGNNIALSDFLGDDSLGQAHLGEHIDSNKPVAVILLKEDASKRDPRRVEQFHNEAKTLKNLKHPYIVRGLESDKTREVECLVME